MMRTCDMSRRHALALGAGAAACAALRAGGVAGGRRAPASSPMTGDVKPIGRDEYLARIDKARKLMAQHGIGALLIEPGASLVYFTGVQWWRSERLTAAILPREGDIAIVTPHFEEPSVRESLMVPAEVRVWNEDENPLADRRRHPARSQGARTGGHRGDRALLRHRWPDARHARRADHERRRRGARLPHDQDRQPKSRCMQKAADITIAAYRHIAPRIERGMTPADIGALMKTAHEALGAQHEFALILLGEASAYPHGSGQPQAVRDGEVVLMDCGCSVAGLPVRHLAHLRVRRSQCRAAQGLEADARGPAASPSKPRASALPAGAVDDAVRAQYEKWGYGPGYKLPGTSHRTGHGIGLDGHEPVNLVHGEATPLAPGMCFSNEPGIYLPGKFGIRLEDCFHMGEKEPVWFSKPPDSLDKPFG